MVIQVFTYTMVLHYFPAYALPIILAIALAAWTAMFVIQRPVPPLVAAPEPQPASKEEDHDDGAHPLARP